MSGKNTNRNEKNKIGKGHKTYEKCYKRSNEQTAELNVSSTQTFLEHTRCTSFQYLLRINICKFYFISSVSQLKSRTDRSIEITKEKK